MKRLKLVIPIIAMLMLVSCSLPTTNVRNVGDPPKLNNMQLGARNGLTDTEKMYRAAYGDNQVGIFYYKVDNTIKTMKIDLLKLDSNGKWNPISLSNKYGLLKRSP